ncbi:MAG: FtsX-like permease family protein [Eubacteriaceae bacterium]|nr:FtsX-like permease family protein [Eubacteriaceae bacterium]
MSLRESFKIALDSIRSNKLRSFLTMLGIIIGIASVIAILSLGEGGKRYITGVFEQIGATTLEIKVSGADAEQSDYFTQDDIKYIKGNVSNVKYATPIGQNRGRAITDAKEKFTVITGGSEDLIYIRDLTIIEGRFYSEAEAEEARNVMVIDVDGAQAIFGRKTEIVGESLNIAIGSTQRTVKIIGVTESITGLGAAFAGSDEIPAFAFVPYKFYIDMTGDDGLVSSFYISSMSKETTDEVARTVINLLNLRKGNAERDMYEAADFLSTLDQIGSIVTIFTNFIGAVAAISLLVGGIGVMNIMLVSVTERTREIGIRKAIGATTTNIMLQFLTESVIISLIGGVLGMAVGIAGAMIGGNQIGVTAVLSIREIVGVILFSSAIGIFFGLYPARKAALMNPIDALRYE